MRLFAKATPVDRYIFLTLKVESFLSLVKCFLAIYPTLGY